mmetsp:Transcript_14812/g.27413  ORF Transcript_14812/g.27413 Transcript_14812/m.27413 type:complete len:212 (-) Transcript_14812:378-1013(-)
MGNKPKESTFWQQEFTGQRPSFTIKKSVFLLLFLATGFIALGLAISQEAKCKQHSGLLEYSKRYDDLECQRGQCCMTLEVEEDMAAPVFAYLEFHNFYQNHIEFVKSRDYLQLRGEDRTESELTNCGETTTMSDIPVELWPTNSSLKPDDVALPCGLSARYFPFDKFEISKLNKTIELETSGIAWDLDTSYVYDMPKDNESYWLNVEDGER